MTPQARLEAGAEHPRHKPFVDFDVGKRSLAFCSFGHAVPTMEGAPMGNASLRARFGADEPSASTISRLIRDTVDAGLIKPYDPNGGRKYMTYVPAWA